MKANLYSLEGQTKDEVDLPKVFESRLRDDLVKRAVLSEESKLRQPKGAFKRAGLQTSAKYVGTKDAYGTVKNMGIPHLPHEVLPNGRLGQVKIVPQAEQGRKAHPPKVEKKIVEFLNDKEHKKALRAAIAFTADKETVEKRNESVNIDVKTPIVLDKEFENLKKTQKVVEVLRNLNLYQLVEKAKNNNTKSLLIVYKDGTIERAARNLPGVDVVNISNLEVRHLAPGTHPGRVTLYTKSAIKELEGEE